MSKIYFEGNRKFQDQFDSRKLGDRAEELIVHDQLTEDDCEFIESRDMFFISTVNQQGSPTVSYKGGDTGFVRVLDSRSIAFPSYDGNGMFLSAGNIITNNEVGLLFIDFENPRRLRLHGKAMIEKNDPLLHEYYEADFIIRISVSNVFINCPRYVHRYKKVDSSEYIPKKGCETPTPEWKRLEAVQDVLPNKVKRHPDIKN